MNALDTILDNMSVATFFLLLFNFVISWLFRSKSFAIFRGIILTVYSLIFIAVFDTLINFIPLPIIVLLHGLVFADSLLLVRPKMRSVIMRVLVNWPGQWFLGATILAFPWALWSLPFDNINFLYIPYILGGIGLIQNFYCTQESVYIDLSDNVEPLKLSRLNLAKPSANDTEKLHIVQLTDPHLGPYMSIERLKRICEDAVAQNPDLILLTGDFLTMESKETAQILTQSLKPLKVFKGKVFACMGNHDYEAPEIVKEALTNNDITLLIDESQIVQTRLGPVQVIGFGYHFKDKVSKLNQAMKGLLNSGNVIASIAMLHDPAHILSLPSNQIDLILSGHTHGGQIGLLSLGFKTTILSLFSKTPDHGLWGLGKIKLYVHRGTGHYGFPFRLGVPAEQSVIKLTLDNKAAHARVIET
jgi:predicted MPP superfamily phosphohydrolase